ncbi:MAG: hypothetical protein GQ532_19360 [Methylomarinum sp.]|nr:hypothetical protein [Methylomarinum sp.]
MKKINNRELGLIIVLVSSVFIATFVLLRIQPLRDELIVLKKDKQKVQKKFNKEKSGKASRGSVKKLQQEFDELTLKIDSEGKTMAGYQQSFIDLQDSGKQAQLKSAITQLIESQGLIISDIREESKSLDSLVNAQTKKGGQGIKRPMIGLKLTGSFTMLNGFIQQLESLSNSVVITRLSITVKRDDGMRAPYVLSTELSLAL